MDEHDIPNDASPRFSQETHQASHAIELIENSLHSARHPMQWFSRPASWLAALVLSLPFVAAGNTVSWANQLSVLTTVVNQSATATLPAITAAGCNSADQYTECISLTPSQGPAGARVTVNGTGWTDHANRGLDVPLNIGMTEVARAYPSAGGTFSVNLTIPQSAPEGRVEIDAIIGNGGSAQTWYTVSACPSIGFFGAHGVNEGGPGELKDQMGDTVFNTWTRFASQAKVTTIATAVNYPKVSLNEFVQDVTTWQIAQRAVYEGATQLDNEITASYVSCPQERYVLVGFSEGAWVIDNFLRTAGTAVTNRIAGVVLYGDPQYPAGQQGPAAGIARIAYNLPDPYVPTTVSNRFMSLCVSYNITDNGRKRTAYDPLCMYNPMDATNCLVHASDNPPSELCPHLQYARLAATQKGADFLASIAR